MTIISTDQQTLTRIARSVKFTEEFARTGAYKTSKFQFKTKEVGEADKCKADIFYLNQDAGTSTKPIVVDAELRYHDELLRGAPEGHTGFCTFWDNAFYVDHGQHAILCKAVAGINGLGVAGTDTLSYGDCERYFANATSGLLAKSDLPNIKVANLSAFSIAPASFILAYWVNAVGYVAQAPVTSLRVDGNNLQMHVGSWATWHTGTSC